MHSSPSFTSFAIFFYLHLWHMCLAVPSNTAVWPSLAPPNLWQFTSFLFLILPDNCHSPVLSFIKPWWSSVPVEYQIEWHTVCLPLCYLKHVSSVEWSMFVQKRMFVREIILLFYVEFYYTGVSVCLKLSLYLCSPCVCVGLKVKVAIN